MADERQRPRVAASVSWWPLWLTLATGLFLLADRWGWVVLEPALVTLVGLVFATAASAFVLGFLFRVILWWFRRWES